MENKRTKLTKKILKKVLTNSILYVIINTRNEKRKENKNETA